MLSYENQIYLVYYRLRMNEILLQELFNNNNKEGLYKEVKECIEDEFGITDKKFVDDVVELFYDSMED